MTLRELYGLLDGRKSCGVLRRSQLLSRHEELLARLDTSMGNGTVKVTVKVYESGYVLYEEDGKPTVFHLDDICKRDLRYDGVSGSFSFYGESLVPMEVFMSADWSVRLILEGNERLMHNREKVEQDHVEFSYSGISEAMEHLGVTPDFLMSFEDEFIHGKMMEVFEIVRGALNNAQWTAFILVECQGKKQREAATIMGVSQQAVSKDFKKACEVIGRLRESLKEIFYGD